MDDSSVAVSNGDKAAVDEAFVEIAIINATAENHSPTIVDRRCGG